MGQTPAEKARAGTKQVRIDAKFLKDIPVYRRNQAYRHLEKVRTGKATMSPFTDVDVSPAKRLTINKVMFCYLGAGGDDSQQFLYPFAALVCDLEAKPGAGMQIVLNCPILPKVP
jgi:hypothetical protein